MRNTMRSELSLDLSTPTTMPLDARIAEFKEDPERMDQMAEFVDGILKEARLETEKRLELKNASKNREELSHTLCHTIHTRKSFSCAVLLFFFAKYRVSFN
ncbi:uncharacterized protein LOC132264809 isoform X4 [Phlebotomus argentipes]|uniref:uncharacterized protein LOC132264809 isoform X4 n=1 Tax=Phlebotomus argentipes TaxID=94469 RepID=UPI002892C2E5|nr:uncharacterized protein LOC132264809 isoform X4 [Phlebotomus argentipes]